MGSQELDLSVAQTCFEETETPSSSTNLLNNSERKLDSSKMSIKLVDDKHKIASKINSSEILNSRHEQIQNGSFKSCCSTPNEAIENFDENENAFLDDEELEKCLSDWANQESSKLGSQSDSSRQIENTDDLIDEMMNGGDVKAETEICKNKNFEDAIEKDSTLKVDQSFNSCSSYFDDLAAASRNSRKGIFKAKGVKRSSEQQLRGQVNQDLDYNEYSDPVFNKFFSSIDSQLSNELKSEVELDQINLN